MAQKLPNELLTEIIGLLDGADIKNVRLTSRALDKVAAPFLFQRLWISSHPLDLEVFSLVTRNSLLRKGVKELVWDDTTFCEYLTERDIYFRLSEEGTSVWGGTTQGAASEQGYKFFVKACRAHHDIRISRLDETTLNNALPLLTSLETVILTNRSMQRNQDDAIKPVYHVEVGDSPTVRQSLRLPWINGCRCPETMPFTPYVNWSMADEEGDNVLLNDTELDEILDIDYHNGEWDEDWATFPLVTRVTRPFRGLAIVMAALAQSGKQIQNFVVKPQYNGSSYASFDAGISHWYFRKWHAGLDAVSFVFRSLKRLDLKVVAESMENGNITAQQGHLRSLLIEAPALEMLALELDGMPVMEVLDSNTLHPSLTSLRLTCGRVDIMKLFRFLRLHSEVLQSVELSYCSSATVSWSELFWGMRAERLCFKRIWVYEVFEPKGMLGWWYGTSQRKMEDFLLCDGPYPLEYDQGLQGTPLPRLVQTL